MSKLEQLISARKAEIGDLNKKIEEMENQNRQLKLSIHWLKNRYNSSETIPMNASKLSEYSGVALSFAKEMICAKSKVSFAEMQKCDSWDGISSSLSREENVAALVAATGVSEDFASDYIWEHYSFSP